MKDFRTVTLADQVFERLESDIIQGVYPRGEVLTELRLVEQLNVSRTPIREALRRLEQEHLIADTGKGSVVLGITAEDLVDIMDIRCKIEGLASYYAAKNASPEGLARLRHIMDLQEFYFEKRDAEHLREMDDLRQSVQNATYEQKDPLLIYKLESFQLFSKMLNKVNADVLSTLNKAYIPVRENTAENVQRERQERAKVDVNKLQASRMQAAAQAGQAEKQKPMPVHVEKKAGRNDPCPCGSGKKYKNCHGKGL